MPPACPLHGVRYTSGMELRGLAEEEKDEFSALVMAAFHHDATREDVEHWNADLELDRTMVADDGGRMVATAGAFSRMLTVPGGDLPVAAVTAVTVLPTHRRRGLLTAMMRRQLDELREGGEAVAVLRASEGAIYERFGYGVAAWSQQLVAQRPRARLRTPARMPLELVEAADAIDRLDAIHASVRARTPGMLDRRGRWWQSAIFDPEAHRSGQTALRCVVGADGYALYATAPGEADGLPAAEVRVRELAARTPEARTGLWSYLLDIDLTARVVYAEAPDDEPLPLMVTDPDAVRPTRAANLSLRLADLPRALTARTYTSDPDVVLEVDDAFCPWNAGRWRLSGGTCEATGAEPDLALDVATLGAAYLGGVTLRELAAAGRVRELRDGALARASEAFRGAVAPWSPDHF